MLSRFSKRNQRKALMKQQHWSTIPMHLAVPVPSVLQSKKSLPRKLHNVQLCLTQHVRMESKESSSNNNGNNDGDNSNDGSNDNGDNDNGGNDDGSNDNGGNDNGSNDNGGNDNGGNDNGGNNNGGNNNGGNNDGGDDDSSNNNGSNDDSSDDDGTQKEAHTMGEHLEDLEHEAVLVHQNMLQSIPRFALHILCDHSKLWEASAELTKKLKKGDLNVLVCTHVTAVIGLLNIYTDQNLKYSWKRASEVVAKMQRSGMNHA